MNIITILLIVNVFAAIGIIALVLMQQSKGDMGSAFGGGGSQSMFGSRGSANFLSRATSTLVTVFFISSLALAYTYAKRNQADEEIPTISVEQNSEVPSVEEDIVDPSVDENSSVPVIEIPSGDELSVPTLEESAAEIEQAIDAQDSDVPATEQ